MSRLQCQTRRPVSICSLSADALLARIGGCRRSSPPGRQRLSPWLGKGVSRARSCHRLSSRWAETINLGHSRLGWSPDAARCIPSPGVRRNGTEPQPPLPRVEACCVCCGRNRYGTDDNLPSVAGVVTLRLWENLGSWVGLRPWQRPVPAGPFEITHVGWRVTTWPAGYRKRAGLRCGPGRIRRRWCGNVEPSAARHLRLGTGRSWVGAVQGWAAAAATLPTGTPVPAGVWLRAS